MFFKKRFLFLISFLSTFPLLHPLAQNSKKNLQIWPKAEKGYQRFIIQLSTLANEDAARIELIPQKKILVDCNTILIHGNMQSKTIQGWGYNYYRLDSISLPASTLMACPNQTKQNKLISISTNLPFIKYNSKLPIVIYVPKDINLSYRVWSASDLYQGTSK